MPSSWYPDLDQLRRDAKRLLRAAQDGDEAALARFARTDRPPVLADAQHAVAVSVGFSSWSALVAAAKTSAEGDARLTRLILFRPSYDNDGRFRCHTRPPLTDTGRAAAQRLAEWLPTNDTAKSFFRGLPSQDSDVVVVGSAMPPSIEAASIVAQVCGGRLQPPVCDLCETHPGEAEGLTESERIARFGPNSSFVPGAETWEIMRTRASAALVALTNRHRGSTILVAAGSQLIMTSMVVLGGMSAEDWGLVGRGGDKGSVTEWIRIEGGDVRRSGRWGLWRFNAMV